MDLLSYWLYDVLHNFNEIILYGAGYFATILYPELCQSGLKNKIAYVAVSKTDGTEKFKEFQIIQIDQIQCDKESVAVLVAVMQPYQDEVVEKVKSIGYKNIILGTDYLRMPENILRIYQGMNETEFLSLLFVVMSIRKKNIIKILQLFWKSRKIILSMNRIRSYI